MKYQSILHGVAVEKSDAIKEIPKNLNFSVHPNPASGNEILVQFSEPVEKNSKLIIFDVLGKELFQTQIPEGATEYELPIGNLLEGIYYARLSSELEVVTEKFVKK